ncbi:amidase family protein [Umbelopsis sp. PMI_123]|nr:amidase family protein [Umbelopsis sp. PMI_123]
MRSFTALSLSLLTCTLSSVTNAATNPFPMPKCHGFTLEEATIDEIQERLESGHLTSYQLVECYVDRVDQINPYMKGVIELNPDLYKIADKLDQERHHGKVRSPMHGIPILVKENIATADKMNTTCGSDALIGSIVPRDSHVVALLRKAGAIIMGKANLAEWADIRSTNYSEGWSARGGQTRNAYNLTQDPAGSSSGSAHSVSANFVTVAIGTETDGSVIGPAQRAGIIGIKPTVGITSRDGVIAESHSQDTVGTFGKTFMDAAHVLNAIRGIDKRDPITEEQKGCVPDDYTEFVSTKEALKKVRIGIPWKRVWQSSTTINQLPQLFSAIDELKNAGAIIVNNTDLPSIEEISSDPPAWNWMYKNELGLNNESEFTVVCYEFKRDLNKYLSELEYSPVSTLSDIIQYNLDHPETEMKYFKQELLDLCDSDPFTEEEYTAAAAYIHKTTREQGIDAALKNHDVEALLVPSDNWSLCTQIPAQAGYPIVTIPAGIDPFGK